MEALFQIRDLTIQYHGGSAPPAEAVHYVSFDIGTGEVIGLMGESGSGKSSIALALLGLLDRRKAKISGSILFRSQELLSLTEQQLQKLRGAAVSVVFQEPDIALSPVMRVGSQIAEVFHAHGMRSWKECKAAAAKMLARVGLARTDRIFNAYPHQLSGGQRQRIVLAQALACRPELLIADEPTASLDARSQSGFITLLRELKEESHISILLISHTPEIQASLADRLLIMRSGRIIESGPFHKLYREPAHASTRLLFARHLRSSENAADEPGARLQEQCAQ